MIDPPMRASNAPAVPVHPYPGLRQVAREDLEDLDIVIRSLEFADGASTLAGAGEYANCGGCGGCGSCGISERLQ